MAFSPGHKGAQADINITPLVDIVLVLLIIFMVITPLLTKSMPIEVPAKAEFEVDPETVQDQLVIKAFADGHYEFNKTDVLVDGLEDLVRSRIKGRKRSDRVVFFEAEDTTPYGNVVKVMDLTRGAGASTIGIMTGDGEGGQGEGGDAGGWTAPPGTEDARLAIGGIAGLGSIDPKAAIEAVRAQYWPLVGCYQKLLVEQPEATGQVVLSAKVSTSGGVGEAAVVSSTFEDASVGDCLVPALRNVSFPAAGTPLTLSAIPLAFQRAEPEE